MKLTQTQVIIAIVVLVAIIAYFVTKNASAATVVNGAVGAPISEGRVTYTSAPSFDTATTGDTLRGRSGAWSDSHH